ncbi:uncharacterized protein LOC135177927 [Pogoniulus pusillus]|uniref:uncharacterized protein LOC135177927 n=1 Tax=Pogoniulus pusillus TaxID=488313 RepID=UPI0030B96E03
MTAAAAGAHGATPIGCWAQPSFFEEKTQDTVWNVRRGEGACAESIGDETGSSACEQRQLPARTALTHNSALSPLELGRERGRSFCGAAKRKVLAAAAASRTLKLAAGPGTQEFEDSLRAASQKAAPWCLVFVCRALPPARVRGSSLVPTQKAQELPSQPPRPPLHRAPLPDGLQRSYKDGAEDIICSITFGNRFDYHDEDFQKLLQLLEETVRLHGTIASQLYPSFPTVMKFLPGSHQTILKNWKVMRSFVVEKIDRHKEDWNPSESRDYIDSYLQEMAKQLFVKGDSSNSFQEENLVACVLDLLFAGTETTATSGRGRLHHTQGNPSAEASAGDSQLPRNDPAGQAVDCQATSSLCPAQSSLLLNVSVCQLNKSLQYLEGYRAWQDARHTFTPKAQFLAHGALIETWSRR